MRRGSAGWGGVCVCQTVVPSQQGEEGSASLSVLHSSDSSFPSPVKLDEGAETLHVKGPVEGEAYGAC